MKHVLDQTGDLNGQQTYKLFKLYAAPDFVKQASSEDLYGPENGLEARCYADPRNRQFPIHTKAATWLSVAFLKDNENELPNKEAAIIESQLDYYANFHGIKKDVDQLKQRIKEASSDPLSSLPNSDFALILELAGGKVERHYPLRNAKEIQKAAEYIDKFKHIIPLAERQKMAQKVLEKAASHGTLLTREMDNFLERQAGYGVCAASDAAELLNGRVAVLRRKGWGADLRNELEKMAQTCIDAPEQVRAATSLAKMACIVDRIDRLFGLHNEYSNDLPRPEDVLFGVTIKAAEQLVDEHCTTTTGNIYKVADFRRLPLDTIRDVLGDEFAERVSAGGLMVAPRKLAEEAATLPRPDATLLDRLLTQAGITPMAKEATQHGNWLDQDKLLDLAQQRTVG